MNPRKVEQILEVSIPETSLKKTTEQPSGQLTPRQIVRLAAAISAENMESIAEGYMNISSEEIRNKKYEHNDKQAFNTEIIKTWLRKNPNNQVQVSLKIEQKLISRICQPK